MSEIKTTETNKLSPLEKEASIFAQREDLEVGLIAEMTVAFNAGALKLLEVAEEEQRMPFLSAKSEDYVKGFNDGQRSLIKFMKRWCGKGE